MLRITEIFHSIQGESSHAGRPCAFVRLAGCNLRCRWCDSEYTFTGGDHMSVDDVVKQVKSYGCNLVEVTGGEPLAQKEALDLMRRLCDDGLEVLLETSGSIDIAPVDKRVTVILDIKCPCSGEVNENRWENLELLRPTDEVKFVIADRADYEWAREVVVSRDLVRRCPVLFGPVWGALEASSLAEWIVEDKLPVRFQVQLHKYVWSPERRGV